MFLKSINLSFQREDAKFAKRFDGFLGALRAYAFRS
jgi:hypothetical protein